MNFMKRARRDFAGGARHALSLLEVVLALGILATSLVILGNLFDLSVRSAVDARDLTRAQLLCESTISEITAGALPMTGGTALPIESETEWFYSVLVEPTEMEFLQAVTVTVYRDRGDGPPRVSFTLTQWLIDPEFEEATRQEEEQRLESQRETQAEDDAEEEG